MARIPPHMTLVKRKREFHLRKWSENPGEGDVAALQSEKNSRGRGAPVGMPRRWHELMSSAAGPDADPTAASRRNECGTQAGSASTTCRSDNSLMWKSGIPACFA